MMFYRLTNYWPSSVGCADVHEVRGPRVPGVNRMLGRPLPGDFPAVVVTVGERATLPPFFWAGTYLIMDRRSIDVIRHSGETHLTFHPATIIGLLDGQDVESYQHVHFLDYVDCLDRERSVLEFANKDDVSKIISAVLLEEKIPLDRHFFRIKELLLDLVSEKLRDLFADAGIPPIVFQPIDEYRGRELYWPED